MKLEFEIWYYSKVTNREAIELFNESCICYKVGAYRAAFLMSYLGLQNVLKERLLKSDKPPQGINQSHWDRTLKDLSDDTKWDEAVFDNVNRTKPSNPFLIGDDIRKQYEYFRCIRNDCAHAKSNIIGSPHVESLWLFIQSNYNKFIVNGGRDGLLERIKIHYNPVYTRPGSDITPIIEDIITSMPAVEIPMFFKDVHDWMKEIIWTSEFDKSEPTGKFWEEIVCSSNSELRDILYTFIKSDWNIFLKFIDAYPDKLIDILSESSEEFKREFWNEAIFKMFPWGYSNEWDILENVLKNNIIPSDEIDEYIKKLASKAGIPPENKVDFFKSINYVSEIRRKIYGNKINFDAPYGIEYANSNWNRIRFLLLNTDIDYEMVSQLNKAFVASSYGTFHDGLLKLLENNHDICSKYIEVLNQNSLTVPQCIEDIK
ncbi:hypothetical protein AB2T63_13195 [Clostridium butyricum]|uniref:hypothetical protein n=1 Tax=Clostridium butyricum TaxID=1492 RepID=UPI0028FE3E8E|nr:hypothetical protein [Clostridium butyricum]